jgi:hypothetical protein
LWIRPLLPGSDVSCGYLCLPVSTFQWCMGSVLFCHHIQGLMQINTHDIDDLLTTGAPIDTINEHLVGGHHTITYKALTCKHQRASQAGSSRSICAVTALNCVRLAFQLEARECVEETILRSFFSEEMMNVSTLFNFSCRGSLTILISASNGHSKRSNFR